MITIAFTYDTVTPESAEDGDFADHGFYEPGGWFYSVAESGYTPEKDSTRPWKIGELKRAIESARDLRIYEDSGSWWSSVDPDTDYSTGEDTRYSLHVGGVTPATYRRISRALAGKRVLP